MFEFLLKHWVAFLSVRVGCMPRRCAATLLPFEEKTSLCSNRLFRRGGGGGVEDGLLAGKTRLGLGRFECLVWRIPVDPSWLVFRRIEGVVVCGSIRRLPSFNGA